MTSNFGEQAQSSQTYPPGGSPPGAGQQYPQQYTSTPPPPPGYSPGWSPMQGSGLPRGPTLPRWLDLGLILIGIGGILTFVGFLCGAAAIGSFNGTLSAYQGWFEAFFVLTGFGILLIVGGWLFRVIMGFRRASH